MNLLQKRQAAKAARKRRVRAKVRGTSDRPRLSVHRTNKYIYAQVIDDQKGETLVAVHEKHLTKPATTKLERAAQVGTLIGEKSSKAKIASLCFDRGANRYHGRVKAVLESVRQIGIEV